MIYALVLADDVCCHRSEEIMGVFSSEENAKIAADYIASRESGRSVKLEWKAPKYRLDEGIRMAKYNASEWSRRYFYLHPLGINVIRYEYIRDHEPDEDDDENEG